MLNKLLMVSLCFVALGMPNARASKPGRTTKTKPTNKKPPTFNELLIERFNREYPKHRLRQNQLKRFIGGARIVAEHSGFNGTREMVSRFLTIAWHLGTDFVRQPWARKIINDTRLTAEQRSVALLRAYRERSAKLRRRTR